jgi:hypothetical protein
MKNLDYWYGDDVGNKFRTRALEILNVNINAKTRSELTLKEECIIAATEIHSKYPNIYIALSGGWESQVCLHSFIQAGITPNIYILKFPVELNSQDTAIALKQCKKYNIIPKIVNVNFETFIKEHMIDTAKKYQTYSFIQTLHAYYIGQLNEDVLLVDKVNLRRDQNPDLTWSYIRDEDFDFWPDRFNLFNEKKVINNFFSYSPELIYSFLTLPVIQELVKKQTSGKISLNSLKNLIYYQGGFTNLFDENTSRFVKTGSGDRIPGLNEKNSELIQRTLQFKSRNAYISYNDIIAILTNQGNVCQYI